MTIFFTEFVSSFVLGAVGPLLHSLAVLLVVDPVSFIFSSIGVSVLAIAMRLVIFPIAVVNVAVSVDQPAPAVCLVILPIAFINAAVTPDLVSSTVFLAGLTVPFALVLRAVRQRLDRQLILLHSRLVVLIVVASVLKFRQPLPYLLDPGSLLLQLLRVHLDVHGAPHEQPMRHLKSVYFLNHSAR